MNRWIPGRRERPEQDAAAPRESRPPLRLVEGDAYTGWEAIYLDNVHRIYRLMFAKVGNRPDAEDLTAEVFLTALRPMRTSASVGEVRAYLLATARTVLAAHWRRTLGREITTLDVESVAADFGRPPESRRPPERVNEILSALPDRYRRVLELRFLRSYSIRDAAGELGTSVGNVKVLQHRALRLAAEVLRDDSPDESMGR